MEWSEISRAVKLAQEVNGLLTVGRRVFDALVQKATTDEEPVAPKRHYRKRQAPRVIRRYSKAHTAAMRLGWQRRKERLAREAAARTDSTTGIPDTTQDLEEQANASQGLNRGAGGMR